jgi:hypothetical protein
MKDYIGFVAIGSIACGIDRSLTFFLGVQNATPFGIWASFAMAVGFGIWFAVLDIRDERRGRNGP